MNVKFFYVYLIFGGVFVLLIIYNFVQGRLGYTMIYDAVIAVLLFYRGYRAYKTKQDQELM